MNISSTRVTLPRWRSILFVPAHVERFIQSAHSRGADAIHLDLEDSVPYAAKQDARETLPGSIAQLKGNGVDVVIRVNRELCACAKDLEAAIQSGVAAISIPKVTGPEHIRLIDEAITVLELRRNLPVGGIRLLAIIETLEGLANVREIATACPRLAGLAIGSEDLSLDAGFEPIPDNLLLPCQHIIYAAHEANIGAYGFPGSIADYSNMDEFTGLIKKAKSMGFDGAFCIHPKQVDIINLSLMPSDKERVEAEQIVEAYEFAKTHNKGAIEVNGKMVDLPVVERAKKLLTS